ncbi:WD40 repeat-like protein [Setomelanomma holmii]|uniref:ASTRA-associated protein 1 n=1 Tax=Setomelanomma holmii TaxID=210430 RepID=A0A9P4HC13_9PLEO|nr:WD40 repeat-like protein [Setomelanomma holmii]
MAERQSSALPPAPSYILRGHTGQIHSVRFVRQNSRLLTGDADGWVVYWKVETKRALAVWKAHDAAILGTEEWGHDKIITHGRDNSLRVWQLRVQDENTLSTVLPAEDAATPRPKPWLLHTLPVNTLNFCAFSACQEQLPEVSVLRDDSHIAHTSAAPRSAPILIATPSTDDKKINVYQLPEEQLKFVVPKVATVDTGMVMALKILHQHASKSILVLAGYEGGLTAVHNLPRGQSSTARIADLVYLSKPHSQPILSLDASPDGKMFFTSAADARVVTIQPPQKTTNTKHSGQQSLRVRSDGRILATGGWDTRIRIYSTKTLKEVAFLKWHKEGVYAVDFATILDPAELEKHDGAEGEVARRGNGLGKLQKQREEQMQLKHWVVAGAKDGKVSLWEAF